MRKMIFGFVTSAEDEKTSKTEKIKSDSGNMNMLSAWECVCDEFMKTWDPSHH